MLWIDSYGVSEDIPWAEDGGDSVYICWISMWRSVVFNEILFQFIWGRDGDDEFHLGTEMDQLIMTETNNGDDSRGNFWGFKGNDGLVIVIALFMHMMVVNLGCGFLKSFNFFIPIYIVTITWAQIRKRLPKGYDEDFIEEMLTGGSGSETEKVKYQIVYTRGEEE